MEHFNYRQIKVSYCYPSFTAKRGVQHIFEPSVRLWFENQYFGYLCSDVLLGVTSAQLDSISSRIEGHLGTRAI